MLMCSQCFDWISRIFDETVGFTVSQITVVEIKVSDIVTMLCDSRDVSTA